MEPQGKLLCDPSEKADREGANGLEQIEYVSSLVDAGISALRESHVLKLHELAVQGIYSCAGNFRRVEVTVGTHTPPAAVLVRSLTHDALDWINSNRNHRSALELAAYALWRFNWIHPFAGGNGRTSRSVAYLLICMEDGATLPGKPTVPALIYKHRDEYVAALRAADAAEAEGREDFSEMVSFLREMVMMQLAAVVDKLSGLPPA